MQMDSVLKCYKSILEVLRMTRKIELLLWKSDDGKVIVLIGNE